MSKSVAASLVPFRWLVLCCIVIRLFLSEGSPASAQTVKHAELLGRPTDRSVDIQMFFDGDCEARVAYGNVSGNLAQQTAWTLIPDGAPAIFHLDGLNPSMRYYYQVEFRQPGAGASTLQPEFMFHTARNPGDSFTFVIQADPHLDEQSDTLLYQRCLQNQLEDQPDFMIDLGDFLMSDKLMDSNRVIPRDTVSYRAKLLRRYYEIACHSVPLFNVMGNHEGEAGWLWDGTPNCLPVWSVQDRNQFFLNPLPDGFYSGDTAHYPIIGQRSGYFAWQWGDALFIALDPYWFTDPKPDSLTGWNWTLGRQQYDWLKSVLNTSGARYKFVFAHQLVGGSEEGRGGVEFANRYEWGGDNLDGTPGFAANRAGWDEPIKDLLTRNRVTVFFHGHDHFFGKQDLDCLVYQEVPQPSHPNFQSANQAVDYGYFSGLILPNSGHLRVTVDPSGVLVEYVRAYTPDDETPTRHNKDVSASYFIGSVNCYDSVSTQVPVIWNASYSDEIAYPNPFLQQTTIRFSIPVSGSYRLAVYDSYGTRVRELMPLRRLAEGEYQVVWEGDNQEGARVPYGCYHYRLEGETGNVASGTLLFTGKD